MCSPTRPAGERLFVGKFDGLVGSTSTVGLSKVGHCFWVREQIQGLFKSLDVGDRQDDGARASVLRDHNPSVLRFDTFDDLRQVSLRLGEGPFLLAQCLNNHLTADRRR